MYECVSKGFFMVPQTPPRRRATARSLRCLQGTKRGKTRRAQQRARQRAHAVPISKRTDDGAKCVEDARESKTTKGYKPSRSRRRRGPALTTKLTTQSRNECHQSRRKPNESIQCNENGSQPGAGSFCFFVRHHLSLLLLVCLSLFCRSRPY